MFVRAFVLVGKVDRQRYVDADFLSHQIVGIKKKTVNSHLTKLTIQHTLNELQKLNEKQSILVI